MCFSSSFEIKRGNFVTLRQPVLTKFYILPWLFAENYISIEILDQHKKNISSYYENMMKDLNIIVASIRNEELERLPQITESLKNLNHEITVIKEKSKSVYNEMISVRNDLARLQDNVIITLSQSMTLNEVCNLLIIAHAELYY